MLSSSGTPGATVILAIWLTQKCLSHSSRCSPALQGPRNLLGPARAAEDWGGKALPSQMSYTGWEVMCHRGRGCSRHEDETSAVAPSATMAHLHGTACSPPVGLSTPLHHSPKLLFSDATEITSCLGFIVARDTTELTSVKNFGAVPGWDF